MIPTEILYIIVAVSVGTLWSLLMSTTVTPFFVTKRLEAKYGNEEWISDTFSKSWDLMSKDIAPKIGKSVMNSLAGSMSKTQQMVEGAVEEMENGILDDVPQIPIQDLAKYSSFARSYARNSKVRDTLEMVSQYLPIIQQLGNAGGNGNNYMSPPGSGGGPGGSW